MNGVNKCEQGGKPLNQRKLSIKKIRNYCWQICYIYRCIRKWGRFPRTFLFDKEKKVVYLNNPKVACSSIKRSMFGEQPNIHNLTDHSTNELSIEMNQYYKFTFVRNPFKRLVSCFEDKCIQHPDDICWNYYFLSNLLHVRSFNQFVCRVCLIPNCLAEPHFSGQYQLIYDKEDKCLVDYVGKMENIQEEYVDIQERFGFRPIPHTNRAASLTGKNWMDYYTPFTAWLVYRKYRKDFIAFEYEDEYLKLKSYFKTKSK